MVQARLQEHLDARCVRGDEGRGIGDRAVDVCFRREIEHRVVTGDEPRQQRRVTDIAVGEGVSRAPRDRFQVGEVPGVGELVQHGDVRPGETRETVSEQGPDVVRPDEAGPAGHQDSHD